MSSDKQLIASVQEVLNEFLGKMHIDAKVGVTIEADEEGNKMVTIAMTGDDMGHLIGNHGVTLNALQVVLSAILLKKVNEDIRVFIDINNYRGRRKDYLVDLATQAMQQALDSGQSTELPPMNPFERRIVHMALKDQDGIKTESVGEGESRRVVVSVIN